ncbi:MAG: hypothetical protein LAT82_05705 [Nanoarchaeota archaeon]|nr:hypothetical protein [Nanoarchaeota archaeon]
MVIPIYSSNPLNLKEDKLKGTQMTQELESQLILLSKYLGIPDKSSMSNPFIYFNEYYDEFGENPIIPKQLLSDIGKYISSFNGKRYDLELDVIDWDVINRFRKNEGIQSGLEILVSSYFVVQDFVSHLNGRETVFEYPSLDYACLQLRQRGDETSLYLADFFKDMEVIFPSPNFKNSK